MIKNSKPCSDMTHELRVRFADTISVYFEEKFEHLRDDAQVDIDEVTLAVLQTGAAMVMNTLGRSSKENLEWGMRNFVLACAGISGIEVSFDEIGRGEPGDAPP